jgi:DNA helicase-2/ATP-dependent DNA helicase PcrA
MKGLRSLKSELNPHQVKAIETTEGSVLVLAGAGSGKTRVLTERIAFLVREMKVSPDRILAFTFTNKAAGEMRARVARAAGDRGAPSWIGTFHATGLRILRREAKHIGFKNNFAIFDEVDVTSLIKDIMKKKGWKLDEYPPAAIRSMISKWKTGLVPPGEAFENAVDRLEELYATVYGEYAMQLKRCNAFDFDDLIVRVVELFSAHPKVLQRYARQFKYVLVDEFQDTNTIQMVMIDMFASIHHNLFVVGDDDQAIYGWRGATIENILQFDRVYADTVTIRLEENYRSTGTILDASNAVIACNAGRKGKSLWSKKERGEAVRIYHANDDRGEGAAVRDEIRTLIRAGHKRSEIAVLYRTHAQSRALEAAMMRGALPYQIIGGVRFYERKEIKDLLAFLKLISNPADDVSFRRILNVPRRGIGGVTLEKIENAATGESLHPFIRKPGAIDSLGKAQQSRVQEFSKMMASFELMAADQTAHELLSTVIERTGYRDYLKEDPATAQTRLENVEELLNETMRFSSSSENPVLSVFLEDIALLSDLDALKNEEKVSLMTLHNSKGLEFRAVMITGLEEGLLPHYSAFDDDTELEEERRLFYVGMTRAMEKLYLFCAASRMQFGSWTGNRPSRFLDEIPEEHTEMTGSAMPRRSLAGLSASIPSFDSFTESSDVTREDSRYRVGVTVFHPKYGEGKIKKLEGSGAELKVSVQFPGYGTKKFLASYAPFTFRR